MDDLFAREQQILDSAMNHAEEIKRGVECDRCKFELIASEYGKLLKLMRIITKISDKTTINLNSCKLNLLDMVHYDALTGIYNRRFLEDNMKRLIKMLSRSGGSILSVLMIDIDFFKEYNDTYGHHVGDNCLVSVAKAIGECISRADDFAARYGGEEFAVILPNTDETGARIMSERLLENIRSLKIDHERNTVAPYLTISIGAAAGSVLDTPESSDYIKKADEALYISKASGRNKYTFLHM